MWHPVAPDSHIFFKVPICFQYLSPPQKVGIISGRCLKQSDPGMKKRGGLQQRQLTQTGKQKNRCASTSRWFTMPTLQTSSEATPQMVNKRPQTSSRELKRSLPRFQAWTEASTCNWLGVRSYNIIQWIAFQTHSVQVNPMVILGDFQGMLLKRKLKFVLLGTFSVW